MLKILFFLCLVSFSNFSFSQISEVRRITEKLCSPDFHGRGYVNKGDSIAAAYMVSEFKKIGVEPFNGTYLQSFTLDVNTFPEAMEVVQNGKSFVPGKEFVIHPSSSGGAAEYRLEEIVAANILNIEMIRGLIVDLHESKESVAVLLDYTTMGGDTLKTAKQIARELATFFPVVELVDTKFTWSVGREQLFFPLIQIQSSVFDKKSNIKIDIDAQMIHNYESQNVMGYIPSKKKCAKTIMFTAHYDHLGRMGKETYFPGANDNASGTAMLFTLANYFKNNPSKYNILLVGFGGEEAGLVGSEFFVNHSPLKLKKIKFLFNLDIMGSGEDGVTIVNATLFEKEFELLQKINNEKKLLKVIKSRGPAANSDHYWFTEKGVPAFFMYTMGPNKHYHDVFDRYEELSFLEYNDITTLLIEFVNRLK